MVVLRACRILAEGVGSLCALSAVGGWGCGFALACAVVVVVGVVVVVLGVMAAESLRKFKSGSLSIPSISPITSWRLVPFEGCALRADSAPPCDRHVTKMHVNG